MQEIIVYTILAIAAIVVVRGVYMTIKGKRQCNCHSTNDCHSANDCQHCKSCQDCTLNS